MRHNLKFKIEFWKTIFAIRVSKIDFWKTNFENRISKIDFWKSNFKKQSLKIDFWKTNFENRISKIDFWKSNMKTRWHKIVSKQKSIVFEQNRSINRFYFTFLYYYYSSYFCRIARSICYKLILFFVTSLIYRHNLYLGTYVLFSTF